MSMIEKSSNMCIIFNVIDTVDLINLIPMYKTLLHIIT